VFKAVLRGATVLLLAGCGASSSSPILIGLAGPLTDSVGAPMKRAAELAVDEINQAGGINGRQIQLIERDDHGTTDSTVAVATALYNSGVSAVIGHVYSGTTLTASAIYNGGTNPVVAISPSTSSPDLSGIGPYTFRVCPSDLAHGAALANWVYGGLGLRRGTVLFLNDEYGRGVRQTFVTQYTRLGGTIINAVPYLGDQPFVGPYLDRVAQKGQAQFLLVAGNLSEAQEILRQARARGITLPVLGADGLEGIEQSGALAEGVYESLAYLPTLRTAANQRFVKAYTERYPGAALPNQPAAATYDIVYLLRDAIQKAGTSRKAVRDAVAGYDDNHPFDGVTGRIAFDSLGDVPGLKVHIAVVHHGELELAEAE
jgi:branched-chain amino acid transport system substrate-binding protein